MPETVHFDGATHIGLSAVSTTGVTISQDIQNLNPAQMQGSSNVYASKLNIVNADLTVGGSITTGIASIGGGFSTNTFIITDSLQISKTLVTMPIDGVGVIYGSSAVDSQYVYTATVATPVFPSKLFQLNAITGNILAQTTLSNFTNPIFSSSGTNLYLGDSAGNSSNVVILSTTNLSIVGNLSSHSFEVQSGIVTDSTGTVYVSDSVTQQLVTFRYGQQTSYFFIFNFSPGILAIDTLDNLYTVGDDTYIYKFIGNGTILSVFDLIPYTPYGMYNNQIALDSFFNVYIADTRANKIHVFNQDTSFGYDIQCDSVSDLAAISINSNNDLYILHSYGRLMKDKITSRTGDRVYVNSDIIRTIDLESTNIFASSDITSTNSVTTTDVFASGKISSQSLTTSNLIVTEYTQNIQIPGSGWKSIAFGDGVFVAVSYEKAAYSTDLGKTWNTSTLPDTGEPWNFVFYTNASNSVNSGVFLTIGDSNTIAVSRNYGKTWSPLETYISVTQNWTSGCFTFSPNGYVLIGGTEHWGANTDDLDGITWGDATDLIHSTTWTSVSAGNGVFMAVGYGDSGAVSVNGFIWTVLDLTYDINWKSICFGNGFFVVVGYDTTSIRTSNNGVNFYPSSLPVNQSWNSVCFGNGNFVTVGDSSTGAWSDDNAYTWYASTLPHNGPWSSVNYGDGYFVAISTDGFIAISTDVGKTWIQKIGYTVGFGFYSNTSSPGAKSFLITPNNSNTSTPALSLSTNGSGWVGVAGVVYPTCALDVGSGNVSALKFIGDGSLLTNLPNSFIQPLANLAVSNSLTTTNVFASGSVLAARFYGNGSGLSGIQSANISQPFANLAVSNSLTTTNVFASGQIGIGTTVPVAALDVVTSATPGTGAVIAQFGSSIASRWRIHDETEPSGMPPYLYGYAGNGIGLASYGPIKFFPGGEPGPLIMTINQTGGRGDTYLDGKLQINNNGSGAIFNNDESFHNYLYASDGSVNNYTLLVHDNDSDFGANFKPHTMVNFSRVENNGDGNFHLELVNSTQSDHGDYGVGLGFLDTNQGKSSTGESPFILSTHRGDQFSNAIDTSNIAISIAMDGSKNVGINSLPRTGVPLFLYTNDGNAIQVNDTFSVAANGYVYVSNTITAGNLYALDTLRVDNAMTSNVSNTTFFCDTLSIPYINSTSLKASYLNVDLFIGTNVSAANFYGNGSSLSSINSANISQPFSNLVVSNSLSSANITSSKLYILGTLLPTKYSLLNSVGINSYKSTCSSDGTVVAFCNGSSGLRVLNYIGGTWSSETYGTSVSCVSLSDDGKRLLFYNIGTGTYSLDYTTNWASGTLNLVNNGITATNIALSSDGLWACIIENSTGKVATFNYISGTGWTNQVNATISSPSSASFTQNGAQLAIGYNGGVNIYTNGGSSTWPLSSSISSSACNATISSDGTVIETHNSSIGTRIYRLGGSWTSEFFVNTPFDYASLSKDGTVLVTSDRSYTANIYKYSNGSWSNVFVPGISVNNGLGFGLSSTGVVLSVADTNSNIYSIVYPGTYSSYGNSIQVADTFSVTPQGVVSALKFIGDGSLLTNLPNSFIQPLANLAVSNSLTTTNVFASGNVSAARFYGNGSGLSGIQSANISQPFANLSVSNSLTTTNVFATGNVVIGRNITALQANVHVEQSNVFIGNSACVGTVSSTINPVNSLYFDNFTTSGTSTFPNKIVLFNQTGMGFCGFGVGGTTPSTVYFGRGGHIFYYGTTQLLMMNAGGLTSAFPAAIGTTTQQVAYCLQLAARGVNNNYTSNVALRIESSNICMTTGPSYAGFGTTAPTANLHVVGNVYATSNLSIGGSATIASDTFTSPFGTFGTLGILSGVTVGASSTVLGSNIAVFSNISGGTNMLVFNSSAQLGLGTTNPTSTLHVVGNVFASNAISTVNILANTLTLSNTTSRITVTGNIYASNAISTTNLIASNTLTVGTATLGSNIAIFSNISGGSNVVVISSNSYVGIGLTNPTYQLDLSTDNARKATSSTWATVSDIRVKTDIESANLFTCYNNVKNLELKYFKWNYPDVEVSDSHMLGYIAQEVAEYFPNSVKVTDSHGFPDFLSLDTDQILKSMYGALQKTIEDKEALEEKLELAQNDIDLLETRLSDLEALVRTLLPSKEDQVSSGPRSAALMNQM